MSESLDPRIKRVDLPEMAEKSILAENEYWTTFEVFHQDKRGEHHMHVGSVHAPNADLALMFAKEQYGRRKKCVNIWVVPTAAVTAFSLEDSDIFENAVWPEKKYREASGFQVRDQINQYKKKHQIDVKAKKTQEYFGDIEYS